MSVNEEEAKSASTPSFLTALVFNAAVFGIEIVAFTILRPRFKAIYEPRTYVPLDRKRVDPISSMLAWPIAVIKADYRDIKLKNGLDAYFFVRFLRMMIKILVPIWLVSWAVLMPLTSVNTGVEGNEGLDRFTFGNVAPSDSNRFAAHVILVYCFTAWVLYVVRSEMKHFVVTRQAHLISPAHSSSLQATSILVTGIPPRYISEAALRAVFAHLPGNIRRIWINRDLKELPEAFDRREAACNKLESAETKLIKTAVQLKAKAGKKGDKEVAADVDPEGDQTLAARLVPEKDRPMHRLGALPFMGEKVDTIQWARQEIQACNDILEKGRNTIAQDKLETDDWDYRPEEAANADGSFNPLNVAGNVHHVADRAAGLGKNVAGVGKAVLSKLPVGKGGDGNSYPPMNSAFIQFDSQIAAQMAKQLLTHHEPYRMTDKYIEVAPQDIIWSNLNMSPYERRVRFLISFALTAVLIIFWAVPVAFVGAVSNVDKLCSTYSWLNWICGLPDVVKGIISGIFPPVALAILMMLLPIVLRMFASFEGIPSRTGVELSLMTRYFIFQVVHGFLVVTASSGIAAALDDIKNNPGSAATMLAANLPKASTFFLTYIILQGLAGTAGGFLQIVPLIIYYVKLILLGSTPRSVYNIKYTLRTVAWGTLFPTITLLTVISLSYSVISPIVNGLACFTFILFFFLYKYLFLWIFGFGTGEGGGATDTGGMFFPKAIHHVFVGLYVQLVCLAALFFLFRDENDKAGAIPMGIVTVVLILIVVAFHIMIQKSFGPLITALPLSLADKTWRAEPTVSGSTSASPVDRRGKPSVEMVERNNSSDDQVGLTRKETHNTAEQPVKPPKSEDDEYGFLHPAISRPQRTVWLPRDPLGLGEAETAACQEAGVDASVMGTFMNEKGKVDISSAPPDVLKGRRGHVVQEAEDV